MNSDWKLLSDNSWIPFTWFLEIIFFQDSFCSFKSTEIPKKTLFSSLYFSITELKNGNSAIQGLHQLAHISIYLNLCVRDAFCTWWKLKILFYFFYSSAPFYMQYRIQMIVCGIISLCKGNYMLFYQNIFLRIN